MAKSKKKSLKTEAHLKIPKPKTGDQENGLEDDFDFGGIPKNINLKKNIGCGG